MLVEGLVGLSCVKTDQINFRQFWQILYHLAVLLRWHIQTARHLSQHLLYQQSHLDFYYYQVACLTVQGLETHLLTADIEQRPRFSKFDLISTFFITPQTVSCNPPGHVCTWKSTHFFLDLGLELRRQFHTVTDDIYFFLLLQFGYDLNRTVFVVDLFKIVMVHAYIVAHFFLYQLKLFLVLLVTLLVGSQVRVELLGLPAHHFAWLPLYHWVECDVLTAGRPMSLKLFFTMEFIFPEASPHLRCSCIDSLGLNFLFALSGRGSQSTFPSPFYFMILNSSFTPWLVNAIPCRTLSRVPSHTPDW